MREALDGLVTREDPNLLVGHRLADDAAVYLVGEDRALVQTVDFFPPIVDDPYDFGRVAAANSLSDIYAMGARPFLALNIAAFPEAELDPQILKTILEGGAEIAAAAGVTIAGGHTISDKEIKYGLAVTGLVDPRKMVRNSGARVGDALLLTKPLGSGILATALRAQELDESGVSNLVAIMTQLNDKASLAMVKLGASACTDITGYGLIGHAIEIAEASGVTLEIDPFRVPLMDGAWDFASRGIVTGGGQANRVYARDRVDIGGKVPEEIIQILVDPQTSGGLLITMDEPSAQSLMEEIASDYPFTTLIGRVRKRGNYPVALAGRG